MKTVILMRHAKSSWRDRTLDDHDRPLKKRGRKAAPRMACWLASRGWRPDRILCSSARRTRETLELMQAANPALLGAEILPTLYEARPGALMAELQRLPENCASALMLGHQPGQGELLRLLVRAVRHPADRRVFAKFPTAAVAVLEANVETWPALGPGTAELVAYAAPHELDAA